MELQLEPLWLGSFKGSDLDFLECEKLGLEKLERGQLAALWEAQDTIWFDYARLHPVKALYYFAKVYGDVFGEYLGENINHDLRFSRGLKGDVLEHRELRQIVALKLEADRRGQTYRHFLSACFHHFSSIGWTRPPRPAHIVKSAEALERADRSWETLVAGFTRYSADPWFTVDEWVGHPQQQRYEDWIVNNVHLRDRKELALSSALYGQDALRIERAITSFDQDTLDQAVFWQRSLITQS